MKTVAIILGLWVVLASHSDTPDDSLPPSLRMEDLVVLLQSSDPSDRRAATAYVSGTLHGMLWMDHLASNKPQGQHLFCYHSASQEQRRMLAVDLSAFSLVGDGQFHPAEWVSAIVFFGAFGYSFCE